MSGSGEYGISAPNKYYYRLIPDENTATDILRYLEIKFGCSFQSNLSWEPIKFRKCDVVRLWGQARYSDKRIRLLMPMFGVLVHELAHLINRLDDDAVDAHGYSFKKNLQYMWDKILLDKQLISWIEKYDFEKRLYYDKIRRVGYYSGFIVDIGDTVVVLNDEKKPIMKAKIVNFINDERVNVLNLQNFIGSRLSVGTIYRVDTKWLDNPEYYKETYKKITDLTEEELALLMKEVEKI